MPSQKERQGARDPGEAGRRAVDEYGDALARLSDIPEDLMPDVARMLYEAALPLASVAGAERNHCAGCGRWGGNDFSDRDEHDDDCDLYRALLAYQRGADRG